MFVALLYTWVDRTPEEMIVRVKRHADALLDDPAVWARSRPWARRWSSTRNWTACRSRPSSARRTQGPAEGGVAPRARSRGLTNPVAQVAGSSAWVRGTLG